MRINYNKNNIQPNFAMLAVTLNCNSRCLMCHIWKNDIHDEMRPEEYQQIPKTLKSICVTGGEPFLRDDLPKIIEVLRRDRPKTKLLINTNGFTPDRIATLSREILKNHSRIGIRVSMDGLAPAQEEIRGIPNGFQKCLETLRKLKEAGCQDLGINMLLMNKNAGDILKVFELSQQLRIRFHVQLPFSSSFYYQAENRFLRYENQEKLREIFKTIVQKRFASWKPTEWLYGWYESTLPTYTQTGIRPFHCSAGSKFFYLDSLANLYVCNILPIQLGNLRKQSFEELWRSSEATRARTQTERCHQCWSSFAIRTAFPRDRIRLIGQTLAQKIGLTSLLNKSYFSNQFDSM